VKNKLKFGEDHMIFLHLLLRLMINVTPVMIADMLVFPNQPCLELNVLRILLRDFFPIGMIPLSLPLKKDKRF